MVSTRVTVRVWCERVGLAAELELPSDHRSGSAVREQFAADSAASIAAKSAFPSSKPYLRSLIMTFGSLPRLFSCMLRSKNADKHKLHIVLDQTAAGRARDREARARARTSRSPSPPWTPPNQPQHAHALTRGRPRQ